MEFAPHRRKVVLFFGGSFYPLHEGHLRILKAAAEHLTTVNKCQVVECLIVPTHTTSLGRKFKGLRHQSPALHDHRKIFAQRVLHKTLLPGGVLPLSLGNANNGGGTSSLPAAAASPVGPTVTWYDDLRTAPENIGFARLQKNLDREFAALPASHPRSGARIVQVTGIDSKVRQVLRNKSYDEAIIVCDSRGCPEGNEELLADPTINSVQLDPTNMTYTSSTIERFVMKEMFPPCTTMVAALTSLVPLPFEEERSRREPMTMKEMDDGVEKENGAVKEVKKKDHHVDDHRLDAAVDTVGQDPQQSHTVMMAEPTIEFNHKWLRDTGITLGEGKQGLVRLMLLGHHEVAVKIMRLGEEFDKFDGFGTESKVWWRLQELQLDGVLDSKCGATNAFDPRFVKEEVEKQVVATCAEGSSSASSYPRLGAQHRDTHHFDQLPTEEEVMISPPKMKHQKREKRKKMQEGRNNNGAAQQDDDDQPFDPHNESTANKKALKVRKIPLPLHRQRHHPELRHHRLVSPAPHVYAVATVPIPVLRVGQDQDQDQGVLLHKNKDMDEYSTDDDNTIGGDSTTTTAQFGLIVTDVAAGLRRYVDVCQDTPGFTPPEEKEEEQESTKTNTEASTPGAASCSNTPTPTTLPPTFNTIPREDSCVYAPFLAAVPKVTSTLIHTACNQQQQLTKMVSQATIECDTTAAQLGCMTATCCTNQQDEEHDGHPAPPSHPAQQFPPFMQSWLFKHHVIKEMQRVMSLCKAIGLYHRDPKVENFLFTKDGSLVVTDFGVSKFAEDDTWVARGRTIQYPLCAIDTKVYSFDCDEHFVAGSIFEVLAGRPLFSLECAQLGFPWHDTTVVQSLKRQGVVPSLSDEELRAFKTGEKKKTIMIERHLCSDVNVGEDKQETEDSTTAAATTLTTTDGCDEDGALGGAALLREYSRCLTIWQRMLPSVESMERAKKKAAKKGMLLLPSSSSQ